MLASLFVSYKSATATVRALLFFSAPNRHYNTEYKLQQGGITGISVVGSYTSQEMESKVFLLDRDGNV